jgi:hypothetical protein
MLILIGGSLLAATLIGSAFYSWFLLLTGKFRTVFIMPSYENDPPEKGKKWFLFQSIGLLFASLIVVMRTWQFSQGHTDNVINNLIYAVSGFLLIRAIGEFKHMGLFKSNKSGEFARIDTKVLTPMSYLMFLLSLVLL